MKHKTFLRYLFGPRCGRTPWSVVCMLAAIYAFGLYVSGGGAPAWIIVAFIVSTVLGLVLGAWNNYGRDNGPGRT